MFSFGSRKALAKPDVVSIWDLFVRGEEEVARVCGSTLKRSETTYAVCGPSISRARVCVPKMTNERRVYIRRLEAMRRPETTVTRRDRDGQGGGRAESSKNKTLGRPEENGLGRSWRRRRWTVNLKPRATRTPSARVPVAYGCIQRTAHFVTHRRKFEKSPSQTNRMYLFLHASNTSTESSSIRKRPRDLYAKTDQKRK